MNRLNFQRVMLLFLLFATYNTYAQIGNGFESVTGRNLDDGCHYVDTDNTTIHQLQNYVGPCGLITVILPGTGSVLGFENILNPTGIGLSDGDAFGVINAAGLTSQANISAPEGTQAFIMEDVDGIISMNFDLVDLNGTSNPSASLQYFLEGTSWEVDDFLYAHIEITNCSAMTSLTLLDTRGSDIDDLGLEESWNSLSQDLTAYNACNAQLIIEFASNSSSEELFIDNIQFTEGTLLPVELISFTVKQVQNSIILNWETASEMNNEGFIVQHSRDGRSWKDLSFIDGVGHSNKLENYQYIDNDPEAGYNYYRIKQLDFDGKSSTSEIVAIDFADSNTNVFSISPNPFNNILEIKSNGSYSNNIYLEILNNQGQVVDRRNVSFNDSQINLDLDNLSEGLYFLHIWDGKTLSVRKVVKN